MKLRDHGRTGRLPSQTIGYRERRLSRGGALKALGPVIYAVLVDDQVKIGFTANLANRISGLHATEVLGFRPGTLAEEQEIHARLQGLAVTGREWYPRLPAVLDVVNEMRDTIGLPRLEA